VRYLKNEQLLGSLKAMINSENNGLSAPFTLLFKYKGSANTQQFVGHVLRINE